jgi:phosphotransferase system  glucose/maltose/N-acetylglucosamine-specific IIC component
MAMPPYQYPPQPYGWGPREHPQGTTVLILGILSLVVCGLLGPFAWTMGYSALQEIDANPSAYSNRGMVLAGYICGIIASCLLILGVVIIAVALIAAASSS